MLHAPVAESTSTVAKTVGLPSPGSTQIFSLCALPLPGCNIVAVPENSSMRSVVYPPALTCVGKLPTSSGAGNVVAVGKRRRGKRVLPIAGSSVGDDGTGGEVQQCVSSEKHVAVEDLNDAGGFCMSRHRQRVVVDGHCRWLRGRDRVQVEFVGVIPTIQGHRFGGVPGGKTAVCDVVGVVGV